MCLIPDNCYADLTEMEKKTTFRSLNEEYDPEPELRDTLVKLSMQCHLKVWHDHSDILGYSHIW